jgi:hypothetical protein
VTGTGQLIDWFQNFYELRPFFPLAMDSDYLYIFLSGPLGFPIRISEIGQDTAQRAHDFVSNRIDLSQH